MRMLHPFYGSTRIDAGGPKGTRLPAAKLKCKPFAAWIGRAMEEVDGMPMARRFYASLLGLALTSGVAGSGSECQAAAEWPTAGSNWHLVLWTDAVTVSIDAAS